MTSTTQNVFIIAEAGVNHNGGVALALALRLCDAAPTAAVDIAAGEIITAEKLICRRPATGIAPRDLHRVIGQFAKNRSCCRVCTAME